MVNHLHINIGAELIPCHLQVESCKKPVSFSTGLAHDTDNRNCQDGSPHNCAHINVISVQNGVGCSTKFCI